MTSAPRRVSTSTPTKKANGIRNGMAHSPGRNPVGRPCLCANKRRRIVVAAEIHITGQKQLGRFQRDFTARFPHLGVQFFSKDEFGKAAKGEAMTPLDPKLKISEVRTVKVVSDFKIVGNLQVGTFEARMREIFGLYVQVCTQKGDEKFYTSGAEDKDTLQELNDKQAAKGYDKYTN